ncbi:MAG: hypothetical protein R3Y60_05330 [bacterium]
MLKRRIIFSLVFIFFALYSIFFKGSKIYFLLFGLWPFVFYINKIIKISFPLPFEVISIIFIFLALGLGSELRYYDIYPWYDLFLHIIAGGIFAFGSIYYLYNMEITNKMKYVLVVLISMGCASLWELYEYGSDTFFGMNTQRVEEGLYDTMNDITVHALGTVIVVGIYFVDNKFNDSNVVEKLCDK